MKKEFGGKQRTIDPAIIEDGECEYCDHQPLWQELRKMWGIAFTGHSEDTVKATDYSTGKEYDKTLIPCPSEWDRPLDVINKWPRNRPRK